MAVTAAAGAIGAIANLFQIVRGDYEGLNVVLLAAFLLVCAVAVHPILTGNTG
ncbi:hypothetical protein SAMN04487945_2026 [Halobacterium jilantaiense]|uniref:Uncharacterized protein n=1 Tax=Halobacterium jilantaiense TaxID=355548 RepID=A0A1I0PWG2_9EURY|nr:hypothetical protein SAMN04487945_2026 [Halobacterium jilantaiense]